MPKARINQAIYSNRLALGLAATALCLSMASTSQAQNSQARPTFGTISQANGFGSFSQSIQAGGDIDASTLAANCTGFIADSPDIIFEYNGDASVLIEAVSDADTTLVIEAPDGAILCNDDFVEFNPGIATPTQEPGRYAVWLGTFDPIEDDTYPDADLIFTEQASTAPPARPQTSPGFASTGFNAGEAPTFGEIAVTQGFGTQEFSLQAGGFVDAGDNDAACNGFIADVPDYTINVQPGAGSFLDLAVTSDVDTTLVVVSQTGEVFCNDDDIDLNPGLQIGNAPSGLYAVWVGTFLEVENDFFPDATLSVGLSGPSSSTTGGGSSSAVPATGRFALQPAFGSINLGEGFGSHRVEILAGGPLQGNDLDPSCNGFIAEAPDYVVSYSGGNALRITTSSDEDTTMAVRLPNGQIQCNDDFDGLNAGLVAPSGLTGDFAIWIGTFSEQDDVFPETTVFVEEIVSNKPQPSGAITSMSLTAGFTPDPFTTIIAAGGDISASSIDAGCVGNIAAVPDFVLNYTAGDFPLQFFVNSDTDTTLLVRAPGGQVLCNDDSDGLNPAVSITSPSSGRYEVFVGTFSSSASFPEATLALTEILDDKVLPAGAQTQTTVVPGSTRQDFSLLAGGSFDAFDSFGGNCNGFVASAPDFVAFVDQSGLDLEVTIRSAEDTTLALRTPSGQFLCDDDSGGDFNPLVIVEQAQAGAYEIWLGTFSSVGNAPATLSLGDFNAGFGTAPNVPGGGKK